MTHRPSPLLRLTSQGLYCAAGDFFIDPSRAVHRAVITHAHSDHARPGHRQYLTTEDGRRVLQARMGAKARIETLPYGRQISLNGVRVSLHPAGHVLGSAQVRVEYRGEVWGISGDYKLDPDRTCRPFEPMRCNTFVTESTFGLPIYRWPKQESVFAQINDWWRRNRNDGRASVIFAYSFGKAQRLLAGLDPSIGPIYCHEAVDQVNQEYRETSISLPETIVSSSCGPDAAQPGAMIIAPPGAAGTDWLAGFGDAATACASGWMLVRKTRRWRHADRGFILSDHADWPGLHEAIQATGAEHVLVTHGQVGVMVRSLNQQGIRAAALKELAHESAPELKLSD